MAAAALLVVTAGCSGINAGKSISPLDFLLPNGGGLMRSLLFVPPPPDPASPVVPTPETQRAIV